MQVAAKSLQKSPVASRGKKESVTSRSTISLSRDVYKKIDQLRNGEARSAWLGHLVEKEARSRARENLAALLQVQYTEEVCQETLRLNEEFPVHEF